MIRENELVMLFLSVGVFFFFIINKEKLKRFNEWMVLFTGFLLMFCACIMTIIEGFIWHDLFNYMEHACYAGSSILLAIWSWKVFENIKEKK